MKHLNPTLWRTCRMLSGAVRLRLLRALHEQPGQSVAELAKRAGIGKSDASQELRRIQSRGVLRSGREGARVIYRLEADPQVVSAAPLVRALQSALSRYPADQDEEMRRLAWGLAYPRRVAMVQALVRAPRNGGELGQALQWPGVTVYRHVRILKESGWVRWAGGRLEVVRPEHPLGHALLKLAETE